MRTRRGAILLLVLTLMRGASGADVPTRLTFDALDKQRPSWSPDGRRLAFARLEADGTHILQYWIDPAAPAAPHRLTTANALDYNGVFAPDGRRLLVVVNSLSGTQGNLDIAVINADGTGQAMVARDVGKLSHQDWPAWSPDGARFAFSSTHDGNQEIYTAAADGTGVIRVTQATGLDAHPCWSHDGNALIFATDRWGGLELARCRPDGGSVTRLTQSPGLDDYPAFSPDGTRLAFVSNRDGQFEVYVARADGTRPVNVSRHPLRDTYPTWTPDGRGVTFVSNRDGGGDLYTVTISD